MDNKLKIINRLGKNMENMFTMHELSKEINIPYATFYRTIQNMQDLINIKSIGKAKAIQIKKEHPAIKAYLTISSEEEKKEFLKKKPIIKKISAELETNDIVILFGSYAKEKEKEGSDIDIIVINKKGSRSVSFSRYETIFKKKINPIFLSPDEFKKMLREKGENVAKQALKHNILLNNSEGFWGCVLDGGLQGTV